MANLSYPVISIKDNMLYMETKIKTDNRRYSIMDNSTSWAHSLPRCAGFLWPAGALKEIR